MKGSNDQKTLMTTGIDREMLTEAFMNLENLHTVGIRDFNNDKRYRDGFGASWTSWGASTVQRKTGLSLQFSHDWPVFVTHLFQTLLLALGRAKRTPDAMEILLRRGALVNGAFHVADFLRPTISPVLESLKTLLLTVDVSSRQMYIADAKDSGSGTSLREFLNHTPNITQLRLNLQKYQATNNENFLRWLSESPVSLKSPAATCLDPAPVTLAYLATLEFGQFNVQPQLLLRVVAKFAPTLRDLSLWRLGLHDATHSISHTRKPNMWAGLFGQLASMPNLQLDHLKVGMLNQDSLHVQFKYPNTDDAPVLKKEYSGKHMDGFLKELVEQVFVVWPRENDPTDSDAEGEDDEEDEEDEEMADDDDDGGDDDDGDGNTGEA